MWKKNRFNMSSFSFSRVLAWTFAGVDVCVGLCTRIILFPLKAFLLSKNKKAIKYMTYDIWTFEFYEQCK